MRITRIAAAAGIAVTLAAGTTAAAATPPATPVGTKLAVLKGAGTVPEDNFGFSVAISGKTAVVGDNPSENPGNPPGRAWVFTETAAGWKQVAVLKGSDTVPLDGFGSAVAISGTTIVVGAPSAVGGGFAPGRAYIFSKSAAGWKQVAELKEPDPTTSGDEFGYAVAISGTTAVVGAPNHPHGTGTGQGFGETYVFTKTAAGWKQNAELKGPGNQTKSGGFGISVGVSGTTLAVGAPYADTFAGRAFVFTKTAAGWKQAAELKGSDTVGGDNFTGDHLGWSAAVSGTTLVVGAPHHANLSGSVYVFTKTATGWKQAAEFKGAFTTIELGLRVGVSGNTLIANEGLIGAYLFAKTAAGWKRIATLKRPGDQGDAVAISGSLAIVGSPSYFTPQNKQVTGHAYVFEA